MDPSENNPLNRLAAMKLKKSRRSIEKRALKRANKQSLSYQLFMQDVQRQTKRQAAALLEAVNSNDTLKVRELLMQQCDPNAADEQMRTGLHIAVAKGYLDIVKELLKFRANPNIRDLIGNTPLHLAVCVHNPLPMVDELLKSQAKFNALDRHGKKPIDLASSRLNILRERLETANEEMTKMLDELEQVVCSLWVSESLADTSKGFQRRRKYFSSKPVTYHTVPEAPPSMARLMDNIQNMSID